MASSQHCVQLACSRGLYIGWRLWRLNYRTHSGEEQVDVRTHKHKQRLLRGFGAASRRPLLQP